MKKDPGFSTHSMVTNGEAKQKVLIYIKKAAWNLPGSLLINCDVWCVLAVVIVIHTLYSVLLFVLWFMLDTNVCQFSVFLWFIFLFVVISLFSCLMLSFISVEVVSGFYEVGYFW